MKKLTLGILMTALLSASAMADISVIVHPDNTASLDQKKVQRIFLGKTKTFPDGREAIPANLPATSPETDEFNQSVLGRQTTQVSAHWSKLMFTGKGTPPRELKSAAAILDFVGNNRDAIAYVDSAAVDGSVKVLFTQSN